MPDIITTTITTKQQQQQQRQAHKCRVGSLVCRRAHTFTRAKNALKLYAYVCLRMFVCACVRVFVETCVYGGKLMAHKIITERT